MAFTQDMAFMQEEQKKLCEAGREFASGGAEDTESDPSTEFGSDGWDSECSEDDCESVFTTFAAEDTFLIFDWDDTLLPTTWIEKQGLRLDEGSVTTKEQELELQHMAVLAKETLEAAKAHGEVILVTNAERGWVELSCQKWMPALCDCLQDVRVLSARSTYEQQGVALPSEWKYLAFQQELARICEEPLVGSTTRRMNIISIGDSPHEREALIRVTEDMQDSCVKAVKLMQKPEVQQLRQEHELIGGCIRDLVNHVGHLDLCFDIGF
jgi:hypothetical protein